MVSLKTAGIGATLVTGAAGLTGAVGYATGLFYSNTQINNNPNKNEKSTIVPTTIKYRLSKEGFDILDTGATSTDWNAVLQDYRQATTKTFSGSAENNKEEEDLRNKCKSVLALENSEDYSKARMWCVKKEKMDKVLKRGGYKVLGTDGNVVQGEENSWKQKISTWKTAESKPFSNELTGKIKNTPTDDNENIRLFRAECAKLKITTLDTTGAEFETNFELAKEWCAVKEN